MHKQTKKWEKYNYLGRRKPFIAVTISLIHTVLTNALFKITVNSQKNAEKYNVLLVAGFICLLLTFDMK